MYTLYHGIVMLYTLKYNGLKYSLTIYTFISQLARLNSSASSRVQSANQNTRFGSRWGTIHSVEEVYYNIAI